MMIFVPSQPIVPLRSIFITRCKPGRMITKPSKPTGTCNAPINNKLKPELNEHYLDAKPSISGKFWNYGA